MSGSLVDPLAKLGRAKDHLLEVADELASMGDLRQNGVPLYAERDGREYRFYVGNLPTLDVERLALLVGDCLFNLRAALDHLVYELHVRRFRDRVPADVEKSSAFPLKLAAPKNPREKWGQIAALSLKHQTAIKHLQPYVTRNDKWLYTRQALGVLDTLNNIDKHRRLHIARRMPRAVPRPSFPADCGFTYTFEWKPLEPHAQIEVWTFANYVPENVTEEVKMHSYFFADVFIDEGGDPAPLYPLLRAVWESTKRVLRRFAADFPPVDFPALPI